MLLLLYQADSFATMPLAVGEDHGMIDTRTMYNSDRPS